MSTDSLPEHASPSSGAITDERRIALLQQSLLLLSLALFLTVLFWSAWLCDDAFITFRTVDNFVHGYGLTWNVDERVQAYTHPLWMFLFSAVYAVTREPYYTGIFLGVAVTMAALVLLVRKIALSPVAGALAVLTLCFSVAFVDYSTSGLENPLTHLLLVLFFWSFLGDVNGTRRREPVLAGSGGVRSADDPHAAAAVYKAPAWRLSLLASLAAVNRMDTVLLFLPALLFTLWQQRSWRCLWSMALGMLPLVAWMAFSTFYYGFPFPNTAYAKLSNGVPSVALMVQGCYYFWNSLRVDPLTLPLVVAGLGVAFWRRKAPQICIAAGVLLYLLYLVRIGGDFMSGRYFTAPLLAALVILASLDWRSPPAWGSALAAIVLVGCCSIRPLAWGESFGRAYGEGGFDLTRNQTRRAIDAEHGVCDERAYYFHSTGFWRQGLAGRSLYRFARQGFACPSFYQFDWVQPTRWFRTAAEVQGERLAVEIGAVGFPGFLMGPRFHFMDLFGLSDPLLARLPPLPDPYWRIGHFRRGAPVGYLETVRTGKNCLREPHLAEYYDRLKLITQGSLWEGNRLATIWNMNLGRYDRLLEPAIREIRTTPQDPYHFVDPFQLLTDPAKQKRTIPVLTQAIHRDPQNPMAYANRGVLYAMLQMNDEALGDFNRAIGLAPRNATFFVRRGTLSGRRGRLDAAIDDFNRAVALDPICIAAYTQRATAYLKKGELDRAIESMDRVIELEPGDADAYLARGNLQEKRGDKKLAIADFARSISLFPAHDPARYFRMVQALLDTEELRTAYDLGRVPPQKLPETIRDLAWVLATHPDARYRQGAEAVAYAKAAVALSPKKSAEFFDTLAAAYAAAGRFPEAVAAAQKALTLPTDGLQESLPEAIRGRLQLYQAHQAYHLSPAR